MFQPVSTSSVIDGLLAIIGDEKKVKERLKELAEAHRVNDEAFSRIQNTTNEVSLLQMELQKQKEDLERREVVLIENTGKLLQREETLSHGEMKLKEEKNNVLKAKDLIDKEWAKIKDANEALDIREKASQADRIDIEAANKNIVARQNELVDWEKKIIAREDELSRRIAALTAAANV